MSRKHEIPNKAHAALCIANAEPTGVAFDDLVKAGKFTDVNALFEDEHNAGWNGTKGDRVRGRFELVRMGRSYREADAIAEAAKVFGRHVANAYEAVSYASNGWNGIDLVVAFGSSYALPDGYRSVPYLWGGAGRRRLSLPWAAYVWSERYFVLYVCK